MTPEGKIQSHLMKRVKAVGGFCRKVAWEGRAGAPDLIIIINGKIVFVEVKRLAENLSRTRYENMSEWPAAVRTFASSTT